MRPPAGTHRPDFAYASRETEWRAMTDSLCGTSAANVVHALAELSPGSRVVVVAHGDSEISGGRLAASLVLRGVCCLNTVRVPPTEVVVAPDALATRQGYLDCRISASGLRGLMDAWRLRAVGCGESPGDLTQVEQSLIRRARRRADTSNVSPGAENLHLFFPAYRFADTDTLVTVASRDHLRADDALPAVTFVDSLDAATYDFQAWGINPEWVILDIANAGRDLDAEAIQKWVDRFPRARHLCLVPGLGHHLVDRLRGRGFKLSWLREIDVAAGVVELQQQVQCKEVEFRGDAEDLRRLFAIASAARRRAVASDRAAEWAAFNTLRTALHVITSLPVERRYYDAAAIARFTVPTTEELLDSLGRCEIGLGMSDPVLAADLDEARSILGHIASSSDVDCDRKKKLFTAVEDAVQAGTQLCVVVRNRTVRAAVEACLTEAFQTDLSDLNAIGIRIESRRDLRSSRVPSEVSMLWTAYGGFQDLDAMFGSAKRRVTVLLNQLESELFTHDVRTWANRGEAIQQGTERLGVMLPGRKRLVAEISEFSRQIRTNPVTPSIGGNAAEEISRLFEESAVAWTTKGSGNEARGDILRRARAVLFADGSTSYFPEEAVLTVIRPGTDEPMDIGVGEINPADRVVFVERAIGRTIYELMQDALGQSPVVGAAAQMVTLWHRAVSAAGERTKLSPQAIHRELRGHGSSITTVQTIRMWLRGAVLGPRDINDIDRLAAVLGVGQREPAILGEIKSSIQSLRNVYRQFAKVVYRTILVGGTGRRLSQAEQALIDEHGISLADLRDAITTETVVRVAAESELRPAEQIGRRI